LDRLLQGITSQEGDHKRLTEHCSFKPSAHKGYLFIWPCFWQRNQLLGICRHQ